MPPKTPNQTGAVVDTRPRPTRTSKKPARLIDETAAKPAPTKSTSNKIKTTNKANTSKPREKKTQRGRVAKSTTKKKTTTDKKTKTTTTAKKAAAPKDTVAPKESDPQEEPAAPKEPTSPKKTASPKKPSSPKKSTPPKKSTSPKKATSPTRTGEKSILERAAEVAHGVILKAEGTITGTSGKKAGPVVYMRVALCICQSIANGMLFLVQAAGTAKIRGTAGGRAKTPNA